MKRFYLLSVISLFSAGISAQEITGGERTLSADGVTLPRMPRLDSIYQSLPEVMITGERPVSPKPRKANWCSDLPRRIRDLPVDNADHAV